ncbi:hypothetical protein LTR22_014461 [Elasticomyces elasticus]|nr:hypothetical protein LTR22_014461 [Elasticomyces elasticus]KAK4904054.1 hypothetical protein LTR49_026428 [Elasticomyces elasticus]KAK5761792.1 hypothetical protein LTS12_008047 [Elasticomyces elasticus]
MASNISTSTPSLESEKETLDTDLPSPIDTPLKDKNLAQGGEDNAHATTFTPGWRFYLAFISLLVITLMAALDATSLAVAIPRITSALHGTAIEGFWSATSFLLTSTVFQPVFGSFSDIFGRKPMILISLFCFGLGAIMAAVAHGSMALMLVGRSIQGVGGGGVLVLTEIVITDLVPLRFRGQYFSLMGAMWAIGSVSGPLVGGAFSVGPKLWRWIFWINLPFLAIGTPLVIIFLNLHFKQTTIMQQLRRIDWVGAVLFIGSTTGFLIPLTWGGVMYSWSSWRTLVPLIISAAGLVAFVVWEEKYAADPLIRISIVKNRTVALTYAGDFLQGLLLWCNLYFMPLYFQAVKGQSSIMSAVDLFPGTFTVAPAAIVVGILISKFGIWSGWTLVLIGMATRVVLHVHASTATWVIVNLISGIGLGMLIPSLTFAVQAAVPNKDQAYGVSLFTFFRAFGQCVGVAIGGAIFQNSMKREISRHASIAEHASEWSAEASSLVQVIKHMEHGVARDDLLESFANALIVVWMVMVALSAVALILSLGTQHYDLDRPLETDQGLQETEKITVVEDGTASR